MDLYLPALSKEQTKHVDSIRWLLSEQRASGRTFLLAYCFVEYALMNPGVWVHPWDHFHLIGQRQLIHHNVMRSVVFILETIRQNREKDSAYPLLTWKTTQDSFCIDA